jgi:dethiobiotin synthetase
MATAFFVTGTDTGVGKTLVSAALLRAFRRIGKSTIGMKPIAAGAQESERGFYFEDVEALVAASSVQAPRELANPYGLREPIAPHIAAARQGVIIRLDVVERAYRELSGMAEVVIVEGVGGFKVPLDTQLDTSHLARMLGLPVILVVGMRLGCLNHALLTQDAIDSAGLRLAGWVANTIDPEMLAAQANIDTVRERIAAPLLAAIPFQTDPQPEWVADYLDLTALQ